MGPECEVVGVLAVEAKQGVAEVEGEAPFVGPADSATFDPCCCQLLEGHGLW